jgi:GNAT superfamily N-acetyltransferase
MPGNSLAGKHGSGLAEPVTTVEQVDPQDEAGMRRFWEVEYAANMAERPDGISRSHDALVRNAQERSAYYQRWFFAASERGQVLGVADLTFSLKDNPHLVSLGIGVLPAHRRRGIGTRLYDVCAQACADAGRTTLVAEAVETGDSRPGVDFAEALGFEPVHVEDHLVCRLPMDAVQRDSLHRLVAGADDSYETLTWIGPCPDEYVEDYCALRTQMSADVPVGEIAYQPVVYDEARLRAMEARVALSYIHIVAAARRRADGAFSGYSTVMLDPTDEFVLQGDTLVMPEARGHRLGLRLKQATLDVVENQHPERTAIHTWTAIENEPMQRTNRTFGFVPVERAHQLQRVLTAPR